MIGLTHLPVALMGDDHDGVVLALIPNAPKVKYVLPTREKSFHPSLLHYLGVFLTVFAHLFYSGSATLLLLNSRRQIHLQNLLQYTRLPLQHVQHLSMMM